MVTKLQRIFDEKNIKRANQALAHFPFPISHPSPPWEVGNREMWEIRKKRAQAENPVHGISGKC